MSKYRTLIKDTMIFALGNVGSKIIVFFMIPLYTNVLSKEEYGTADLVFTFSQLMMPVVCVAIYNSIVRFGLQNRDHPENTLRCGMLVWIIGCLVSIALIPILGLYKPVSAWKWYLILHVNLNILFTISQNYLKVKGENLKYSIISITQTGILATLNVVLLVVLKFGIKGYLLGNVMASLGAALLAIIAGGVIADVKKGRYEKKLMTEMISYSAPLVFNNIAWWIIQSSDKVMIEGFVGAAALGLYTVASRIPSLVNVVVNIFQQAWGISSIVEMDSSNDKSFYGNVLNMYLVLVFGACLVINAIIQPFMHIYVGPEFYEAWKMAPILVVSAAAFSAVAAFYGSMYAALKKSMNNMVTTLIASVVNIVMNFIFIHLIGAMGAVIGTMISYMILAVSRTIDVNRYIEIEINYKIYVINCVIVTVEAILITQDFYGHLVSAISCILFAFINREELEIMAIKTMWFIRKIGAK